MATWSARARLWAVSALAVLLGALLAPAADPPGVVAAAPPTAFAAPVGHQVEAGLATRATTGLAPQHSVTVADPLDDAARTATPAIASALVERRTDSTRGAGAGDAARERAPPG